ncbi:hypothetical protein OIU76_001628 [Salix suchowensis]|nr:hypothetical protein OIU76_001628 [Salix suchowensis]
MAGVDDGEVRFEEAISCLPSLVLDEAIWESKFRGLVLSHQEYVKQQQHHHHHHHHQYRSLHKLPLDPHPQRSKSSPRPDWRTKYANNWASGGPGMQAVFLDSGKKSSGTGVFLPQRAGTNMQSSKKPACAPVLLPARVVQALNINVHEIGLHISRRQG